MDGIFLITGVSTGFGRAIAEAALAAGHEVVGTVRSEAAARAFEALGERAHARHLDVTDEGAIRPLVDEVENHIGPVGVLINNAGYGLEGTFEETAMDDVRHQFNVNVFGAVAMMQAVLPYMRARRGGHIINVTSMGGFVTFPGLAFYHGSKFALEGISDALGKEVAHLGIHVTALAPSGFRTDWAGRSMTRARHSIADYDAVFVPQRERRQAYSGHQAGDPAKLAQAVLQLVAMPDPPAHLLMGRDAYRMVTDRLSALQAEFAAYSDLSNAVDFED